MEQSRNWTTTHNISTTLGISLLSDWRLHSSERCKLKAADARKSVNGIQQPISTAKIDHAFIHDWRRPDCTNGEHSIKRKHHVLVITKITCVDRLVVQTAIRLQHLQWVALRSFSLKIPQQLTRLGINRQQPPIGYADVNHLAGKRRR